MPPASVWPLASLMLPPVRPFTSSAPPLATVIRLLPSPPVPERAMAPAAIVVGPVNDCRLVMLTVPVPSVVRLPVPLITPE